MTPPSKKSAADLRHDVLCAMSDAVGAREGGSYDAAAVNLLDAYSAKVVEAWRFAGLLRPEERYRAAMRSVQETPA